MNKLIPGIYELLHTKKLRDQLIKSGLLDRSVLVKLEPEELVRRLSVVLARKIAVFISQKCIFNYENWEQELSKILGSAENLTEILEPFCPLDLQSLQQIKADEKFSVLPHPDTPLSSSALLTGSSRTPSLRSQLIKELATCERAEWLVSFIKFSGILPLLHVLQSFTADPHPDGGPRLRIATTSYMGATDLKAVETLLGLPNTEVRISYDTKRTRLHAKSYLFHRGTGFSSAYIGSANISKAALDEGLEWTVKISQYETSHLWAHAVATFASHWEDKNEFSPCHKDDLPALEKALNAERGVEATGGATELFFDLRPYGYQQVVLDDIAAERASGKSKHLIIAATGTGKTMIAAFDYKNFCIDKKRRPRLLFIAHRKEILEQARTAFRHVLRDGSFGELVAGGAEVLRFDHLFCTVQSWNSRNYGALPENHFDYVVIDEAHHNTAASYQAIMERISPLSLMGLTATPERSDGSDIRQDFDGAFTHEIRLPEAIERALLSPFHYFGVPDFEGIDFSALDWKRGGYEKKALGQMLDTNRERADWVMGQVEKYVADIKMIRALGFCVGVEHAKFMAGFCRERGLEAIYLCADSKEEERLSARERLRKREINFIFVADLYNEGVDIPWVDTLLLLRPTESLTLFLQQLGRGLRLYDEKSHLTVLDFIAPQHRNFRFSQRFRALSSRPGMSVEKQIEAGLPYVPAGCFIHLEKQAQDYVLQNIRSATTQMNRNRLVQEMRAFGSQMKGRICLEKMLNLLGFENPDDIYKKGLPNLLLAEAGLGEFSDDLSQKEKESFAKGFRRINLMDDTLLIREMLDLISLDGNDLSPSLSEILFHSLLWGAAGRPENGMNEAREFLNRHLGLKHDLQELLEWLMKNKTPTVSQELTDVTGPLNLHCSYSREQILLSLGQGSFEKPYPSREGVLHVQEKKLDVFFADINKSEADFSPTTMYDDYAITENLFHWQSQSGTGEQSETGRRYIEHEKRGYRPLLFIREQKKRDGLTVPYFFAGPLKYRKHEGSKPISFIWELEYPLPAKALSWARRIS
jgi:superfamily II DNA or RNA helicase/HKD family nuclease